MPASALRPDALAGRDVMVAGGDGSLERQLAALGATTAALEADLLNEKGVGAAVAAAAAPATLVVDAGAAFNAAGAGHDGLRHCVDGSWNVVRAVADRHWIDRDDPGEGARGKLLLLAPLPDAGLHAGAARSALENLARTLSTEWARYAITTAAILPGAATAPEEVGELVAFLASPAGDYFTGCAFTLGGRA